MPEFCLLVGLPAFALTGYLLFMFSNSALSIVPGVMLCGIAGEFFLRRRGHEARELEGAAAEYGRFRLTRAGMLSWAILALAAVVVLVARWGWLTERTAGTMVEMGTLIADDMRTVGFPISLAAFGFPLRNPLAVETLLMYPLGAFIYPAGVVGLLPSLALQAIVADTVVATLYVGMVLAMFAAFVTRGGTALAALYSLTCVFTLAFDWGTVGWFREASWFRVLFDYVKPGVPSVGSTTLVGLVWVQSHALAFAALAAAALLFARTCPGIVTMLVVFGAATSMDMTIFALVAAAIWIAMRRELQPQFVGMCVAAACVAGLIMLPALSGKMDGLRPRGPSLPVDSLARIGAIVSTEGPYLLLIVLAMVWTRERRRLLPCVATCAAPMIFLFSFNSGSFWFWRGHFVMHALLAMLCAAAIAGISSATIRTALIALWAMALIPGIWNSWQQDIRWFQKASVPVTAAQAEAVRWIYRNTPLDARVAAWKTAEGSLVPSVDYLRAGSRAGKKVYDRAHVVIGYQRNLELMSDVARGIAANDYILYEKDDPVFEWMVTGCRAPAVFQNAAAAIYRVDVTCRANLGTPAGDFSSYLAAHPAQAGVLARKRAEELWRERKFTDAVALLRAACDRLPAVAEIRYSLAFSLQQAGLHTEALTAFAKAQELGYAEFWVRYGIGNSYLALGEKSKAITELKRAAILDPVHAGLKTMLEALER